MLLPAVVVWLVGCAPTVGDPYASPDVDGDGFVAAVDCDDLQPLVHAGAPERCDRLDNDCDGEVDEDPVDPETFYADGDADGYGDGAAPVVACAVTAGTSADAGDCDDTRADAHPGAPEHCDGADEDCDGEVDEAALDEVTGWVDADGDGYGDAASPLTACALPAGYVADATDCDDADAARNPAADEVCDGAVDEDCDTRVDDADPDVVGTATWYADGDGDGWGIDADTVVACAAPEGYAAAGGDCDDTDADVFPDADGVCTVPGPPDPTEDPPTSGGEGDSAADSGRDSAADSGRDSAADSGGDPGPDPGVDSAAGDSGTGASAPDVKGDTATDDGAAVPVVDSGADSASDSGADTASDSGADSASDSDDSARDSASDSGDTAVTSAPVRFLVLGDTGDGGAGQYAVAAGMEAVCAAVGCDFVLLLGDNIYPGGVTSTSDPLWTEVFELPYAGLDLPFHAVMGNHDWDQGVDPIHLDAEVAYSAVSTKWSMPADAYTFVEGDITFYGIDTHLVDMGAGADQEAWLPVERAASTTTWNLVFGHHPYRSNGPHGNATGDVETFLDTYVCGQYDVYFAGHDHDLAWMEDTCGTAFLLSGAGRSTYSLTGTEPAYFEAASLGFLWVEIDGGTFTGVFYDDAGTELFRRTITK